jgi:transcriptional regulator with XRE-family HTH domain
MKKAEKIVSKLIDEFSKIRKEKGLSHEKVAALTGLSRRAIGMIENKERIPSILNCQKIADALEISLGDLLKEISKN